MFHVSTFLSFSLHSTLWVVHFCLLIPFLHVIFIPLIYYLLNIFRYFPFRLQNSIFPDIFRFLLQASMSPIALFPLYKFILLIVLLSSCMSSFFPFPSLSSSKPPFSLITVSFLSLVLHSRDPHILPLLSCFAPSPKDSTVKTEAQENDGENRGAKRTEDKNKKKYFIRIKEKKEGLFFDISALLGVAKGPRERQRTFKTK